MISVNYYLDLIEPGLTIWTLYLAKKDRFASNKDFILPEFALGIIGIGILIALLTGLFMVLRRIINKKV